MRDFKAGIITEMNNMFPADSDVMYITRTSKYLTVKCKYQKCVFDLWFNENKNSPGTKIRWYRTINMNHCFEAHMNNDEKDSTNRI